MDNQDRAWTLGEELMMTAPTQPRSANPGQEGVASMRITYGAVLPLAADEAFAFVADPLNWPLFFPGRQAAAKDDDWGRVGGHARLTSIILGRPMTMDVELTKWDPPQRVPVHGLPGGRTRQRRQPQDVPTRAARHAPPSAPSKSRHDQGLPGCSTGCRWPSCAASS